MIIESRPINTDVASWKLPHTLTILATYQCTAACKQCCFQSNPFIQKRVPQENLKKYIHQAAEVGTIRLVCFSGGETFLLGKDLVELIELCTQYNFMTRVVTNGYWATSEKAARKWLEPLVEAGLCELNFSTGDDHSKFVPMQRIVNGMIVAYQMGLGLALMVEDHAGRSITGDHVKDLIRTTNLPLHIAVEEGIVKILESPWMKFSPDDEEVEQSPARVLTAKNVQFRDACTSVLTTAVVTPNEDLGLCCGLPREEIKDLTGGNLREATMKEIIDKTRYDFLKIWLFIEGPEKILAWAASKDPSIEWENKYAHNCDACRAMYKDPKVLIAIERHYEERYDEILFKYALFMEGRPAANALHV